MQKTEKMQFNLIEGNDEVLQSLEALNENFQKIDENIGNGGGIEEETDPTVPEYVKNITEENILAWNNKSDFSGNYEDLNNKPDIYNKTEIDTMLGDVEAILETLTTGSGV